MGGLESAMDDVPELVVAAPASPSRSLGRRGEEVGRLAAALAPWLYRSMAAPHTAVDWVPLPPRLHSQLPPSVSLPRHALLVSQHRCHLAVSCSFAAPLPVHVRREMERGEGGEGMKM